MTVGSDPVGGSPRVYIDAPNTNVKFSAEIKVDNVEQIHLVARTNHQIKRGFGGYHYYLNFKDKQAYFKKEITHGDPDPKTPQGYSSRLDSHPIEFKAGQWYKAELFILNDDRNVNAEGNYETRVKIEGYWDGFPVNDLLDDGTIQCGNDKGTYPNTEPFQGIGKWCFIRADKPNGVYYRNVKVEGILTSSSASMPS